MDETEFRVTAVEVAEKILAARKAQVSWGGLPYRERAEKLKKTARYLSEHIDDITETIHRENGKVRLDALAAELLPALMGISFYLKNGKKFLSSHGIPGGNILMFNKRSRMIYKPYGVVGIISPWNYPFSIPFSEVAMALLAGNAVILKVASDTPGVGRSLAALFAAAGLPPGVFSYVEITGKEAGKAFINGGVDKLFFTGSSATGKELMALAAPRLLPLVLELGGADAAIICDDADLDRAAAGIVWSGFSNAGQSCGGTQRILVHKNVYAPFLDKLCALVRDLRPAETGDKVEGQKSDFDCDLGRMTTLKQKKAVREQVAACLAGGAKIAAQSPGGSLWDDDLLAPALVLTEVTDKMPVMAGEVFGPVVAVIPYEDDDDALAIANASSYGLSGSVWSRSGSRAKRLAAGINAGAVMINDHLMSHGLAETPWGGFGDSGLGRTHGFQGFREMLKAQVVINDILPAVKRDLFWQPYSEKVYRGVRDIVAFLAGPGLGRRLQAVPGVLGIFFRYWKKH
ncbi:MAG: aldehyde dehydrogenase family protein [Treponema sp.]|jgi:succinate-semialdehyde dehydrogenase/glutarate-semialdehyde dehydrogenase|nr:aldehyde dehydrogenase family protein [Treponema sp.]